MSIKKLKNRTLQAKAVQDYQRAGKDFPKVQANVEKSREINEHEDHLVHYDFIHHNFDRVTGTEQGTWTRNQMCYPRDWKNVEGSLAGVATEIVLIHHPDKGAVITPKKEVKESASKEGGEETGLTPKQEKQKEFTEAFGFEPEDKITVAQLEEAIKELGAIKEGVQALGGELELPTTLDDAKAYLEKLQNSEE